MIPIYHTYLKKQGVERNNNLLSPILLEGGSIGGMKTGVLGGGLLGGTIWLERTDLDDLPVDVDRT